ncbi:MAG: ABC transporter permease, partial [Anaerobacillus sp.]
MIESLFPNVLWENMWEATLQTAYMTAISVLATFI